MTKKKLLNEQGVTLVELLAVIVLSSMVLIGAMFWFKSSSEIARQQDYQIEAQQLANLMVGRINNTIKAGNRIAIEDNDSAEVTITDSSGRSHVYRLKNPNCRLVIEREENKDRDLKNPDDMWSLAGNKRRNNTVLHTLTFTFYNEKNQEIYQRATDISQHDEGLKEGWW